MFVKNVPTTLSPGRDQLKQLEYLYARREAIDGLIQSLQDYDRCREKLQDSHPKRKLA
jgi:hypothetical protein